MGSKIGPNITRDGLILYLDASNPLSYPGSGTTWYDLSKQSAHGTIINGTSWSSSGYFTFDGTNDGVDGFDVPQNYVDLFIGMNSGGSNGTGLEMVVGKYNDYDKSFRTFNGTFSHGNGDINDWHYGQTSYDFVNGEFITDNKSLLNKWNIVRLVNQNLTFLQPFVYSLSSDFYDRRYVGKIAFVIMYNRILSNSEVQQNYNALKGRFGL